MNFMNAVQKELNSEKQLTENGAVGYVTSGKKLLDINFKASSFRNMNEDNIKSLFAEAYYEDPIMALKWLFFLRDVRGGMGERRSFRICFDWLIDTRKEVASAVVDLLPEYGRWDDLILLADSKIEDKVVKIVKTQLEMDVMDKSLGKSVSLISKWLPRVNTSSDETVARAKRLASKLGMTEKEYRKLVSSLNKYIKTVEIDMSANKWGEINYESVPSKANLLYKDAFLKHDEVRRKEYLEILKKGEIKINAETLFPHDIVHKYSISCWEVFTTDETIEQLWKNLPDYVKGNNNTIVVADGSGSMCTKVSNTSVTCLEIANALAIYFSERASGQFKDNYITFSRHPKFVDFSNAKTLREKIRIALRHGENSNTDIEATFKLILNAAINNHISQEEMPTNILVISDMEFDEGRNNCGKTLFEEIADEYAEYGYKLPRLIFWNICSRTGTVPLQENDLGVALVSGFSPAIMNMVLSGELDPYKCLLEALNVERYRVIEERIKDII